MKNFRKFLLYIFLGLFLFFPQFSFAKSGYLGYYWSTTDGPLIQITPPKGQAIFAYYDRDAQGWYGSTFNNGSSAWPLNNPSSLIYSHDYTQALFAQLSNLNEADGYNQLQTINNNLAKEGAKATPQPQGVIDALLAGKVDTSAYTPQLKVKIGGTLIEFQGVNCQPGEACTIPWMSQYIAALYQYGVGLAAILAAIMVLIGGFLWLTSAGAPDRITKAKDFITGALTGLFLALFSYMILWTINPELVALKPITLMQVKPTSAPAWTSQGGGAVSGAAAAGCTGGSCIVGGYNFAGYATSPTHVQGVNSYYSQMAGKIKTEADADKFIKQYAPTSQVTGKMVMDTAKKYGISDPAVLIAEMMQDSSLGTAGRAKDSNNPGNVANADSLADTIAGCQPPGTVVDGNCKYPSWEAGVDALGRWLYCHPEGQKPADC